MTSPPAHTANWQPIANLYESLNTLWNLMSAFVDLGFGTDPVQNIPKTESPSSPENLQPMAQGTSNPQDVP